MSSSSSVGSTLAPLNVGAIACYRRGPGASERMAVLPPGHALREIERVEINRFIERDGVTFYIIEVFKKTQRSNASGHHAKPLVGNGRVADMLTGEDDFQDEVLIDVDLNARPAYELERRFSEFEALRNTLSVCFENLHPGVCEYCDTFIDFLACSSVQPGLYTKLTTRAPQRKGILANFINHTIRLSLTTSRGDDDRDAPVHCDGWSLIPRVVEGFLRDPQTVFPE